jgi:hypothetical protein
MRRGASTVIDRGGNRGSRSPGGHQAVTVVQHGLIDPQRMGHAAGGHT